MMKSFSRMSLWLGMMVITAVLALLLGVAIVLYFGALWACGLKPREFLRR